MKRVVVIGSLPPPFTGQNIQTQRNAELIGRHCEVHTINTSTGADELNDERSVLSRIQHYVSLRAGIGHDIKRHNPDAVVWHSVSPQVAGHARDLFTVIPMIPPSTPLFPVVHWGNFDMLFRRRTTRVTAKRLVGRCTGFVFLDESLAQRCAPWIPDDKRFVIPNTVDDAMIPSAATIAEKLGRIGGNLAGGLSGSMVGNTAGGTAGSTAVSDTDSKQPARILFVANMIPSKGFMELLESLPAVRRDCDRQIQARFIGKWVSAGDEKGFLARVQTLGLQDIVEHLGQITDRQELARLYLEADVFALPTYYPTEAQPLSVLEALAAATPVVVSRHASLPNMVDGDNEARFVNPERPEEISDAILELLRPTTHAAAATAARTRFDNSYAPYVISNRWADLIGTNA